MIGFSNGELTTITFKDPTLLVGIMGERLDYSKNIDYTRRRTELPNQKML